MTSWDEVRAAGIAGAEAFLASRDDATALRDLMVAWIEATRAGSESRPDRDAEPPGTAALADAFRTAGLPDLAEYARSPAGGEGPIPAERWLFAVLLGRACAVDLVAGLNVGQWRESNFWGLESYGAWDAFVAELIVILASDAGSRESFWTAVSGVIDTMASDPGAFAWGDAEVKAGVRAAVNEYRAQPSIVEAWETRLDSHVLPERAFVFGLARQLDAARFFGLAERLPHPAFLRLGLGAVDRVSEREIARLLALAQPAFGPDGAFQAVGMIAVRLLTKAAQRLRWLAGNGRVYDAPLSAQYDAQMTSDIARATAGRDVILDALFLRPDAAFLGWAWLEHHVFEGEHRGYWRPGHHAGAGGYVDTWILTIQGLAQRLGVRDDSVPWVLAREALWRSDRVTAVLATAVFAEAPNRTAIGNLLRSMLMEVQPSYPGAASAIAGMGSPLGRVGGFCVLALSDPAAFLATSWQDLRPYRERAWRSAAHGDGANNVAEIFVSWAVHAIEAAPPEVASQLADPVEALLRDAFQTDAQERPSEFWLAAVERFSRAFGKTCANASNETPVRVANFVRPYLRDHEYMARISMALHDAGIATPTITDAQNSFGFDLCEALRDIQKSDDGAGQYRKHNPLWLKKAMKTFCPNERFGGL